ncbi:xylulokinase [Marinicrinis lubricantis]|uniref:Xylulose kinase n=1 Tax=Marinicrinis lubricantis TaxID=2086470 RepID=A0ABW1IQS3_9BACL
MKYVIGVDLGTSAVKTLLVDQNGIVCASATEAYELLQPKSGYNEQNPEDWVKQTALSIRKLLSSSGVTADQVEGISFSGQMHGLVLLDANLKPLRNAILWNDTRTTKQCREIEAKLGDRLLDIARNRALEGFTLPKILWVKENEPELYEKAKLFLLPKDYVRLAMTGEVAMDISDAAGTLMLDVEKGQWSGDICGAFGISMELCPPVVQSVDQTGTVTEAFAKEAGLSASTKVFAGGADNACGAFGSGIIQDGAYMCSIGTSGVVLGFEQNANTDYRGKVHFFNHSRPDTFYAMGVTLAAGYSLSWFAQTFAPDKSFDQLLGNVGNIPAGSNGLLFTPYLVGERTPHADSVIRGSFIGMDATHTLDHFGRAVMEGITFSLNESVELFREGGKKVEQIVSIGGGAKNATWLQMQADVFGAEVLRLKSEQGPGMGAAMIAAVGCGWFSDFSECADKFVEVDEVISPRQDQVKVYQELFAIYKQVYSQTKPLDDQLSKFKA